MDTVRSKTIACQRHKAGGAVAELPRQQASSPQEEPADPRIRSTGLPAETKLVTAGVMGVTGGGTPEEAVTTSNPARAGL